MAELNVLCVGSATLDTIAVIDRYPTEDSRVEAKSMHSAGGGPAATAAVALARLGVSVGFCGRVANDLAGYRIRDDLLAEGVDVTWLRMDGSRTGSSVVLIGQGGSRTIVTVPSDPIDVDDVPVDAADWVHVDQTGYAPVHAALHTAGTARLGIERLSIDHGNPIPTLDLVGVGLYAPTVTQLLARYPGETVEAALAMARRDGAHLVVATDGDRGAWYAGPDDAGHVPAATIPIISTLGAGDVFHGALLAEVVAGGTLRTAVLAAAMTAALSCRALDGRSAIPRRGELDQALAAPTERRGAHDIRS